MKFTKHFRDMLIERKIKLEWVDQALSSPDKVMSEPDGTTHYLRRIPEHGNRWLRVVVNTMVKPNKAVTVFFDRRLK